MATYSAERQQALSNFITNNFTVRQCRRYVKLNWTKEIPLISEEKKRFLSEEHCACGRSLEWHHVQGLTLRNQGPGTASKQISLEDEDLVGESGFISTYWDPGRDTLQKMCNSGFGEIHFNITENCFGMRDYMLKEGLAAKFLRLEGRVDDDYLKKITVLMTTNAFWHFQEPGLILDLIGDAYSCKPDLEEQLSNSFASLIASSNKNNLWIVSNGKNNGLGRIVGRAVAKARLERPCHSNVTCIGIDSWASTANRHSLEADLSDASKSNVISYDVIDRPKNASEHCLEPNHDGFLLVDTGKEIVSLGQNREVNEFRAKLVDHLASEIGNIYPDGATANSSGATANSSSSVPGVLTGVPTSAEKWLERRTSFYNRTPSVILLIGGGLGELDVLKVNLVDAVRIPNDGQNNNGSKMKTRPVLLVTSFGGLADLLAYSLQLSEPKHPPTGAKLTKKQREEYANERANYEQKLAMHPGFQQMLKGFTPGDQLTSKEAEIIIKIGQCLSSGRRNIHVLDLNMQTQSLNVEIFNAIFQTKLYSSKKTLEVCVLLNDPESAKKQLEEVESLRLGQTTLEEFCSKNTQLIFECGLVDFYKLFIQFRHPIGPNTVTPVFAADLYRKVLQPKSRNLGIQLVARLILNQRKTAQCLQDFVSGKNLVSEVGAFFEAIINGADLFDGEDSENSCSAAQLSGTVDYQPCWCFRDVFLLELVMNHNDFALELWKDGADHFKMALVAVLLLRRFSELAESNKVMSEAYAKSAQDWEQQAIDLFKKCGEINHSGISTIQIDCQNALLHERFHWFKSGPSNTAFEIAFERQLNNLACHEAFKSELTKKWYGHISSRMPSCFIWLLAMCPLFWILLPFVKFSVLSTENQKLSSSSSHDDVERLDKDDQVSGKDLAEVKLKFPTFRKNSPNKNISFALALRYLYTAPVVKHSIHLTSNVCFSLLLSKVILAEIAPNTITGSEIVAWIWSFTFFLHCLRPSTVQLFSSSKYCKRRFCCSNALPSVSIAVTQLLFIAAMIMRWALIQDVIYVRTLYSLVCLYFWMRLLGYCQVSKFLGPKYVILVKMLKDLGFFFAIYVTVLFAFAVPIYAMLWPDQPMSNKGNADDYVKLMINIAYNRWWSLFNQIGQDEFDGTCSSTAFQQGGKNTTASTTTLLLFDSDRTMNLAGECPQRNFVAVILYVIFIAITNLLLLNTLTALFTRTSLHTSQEEAEQKWEFTFYRIVKDYQGTMFLPPPLNIFQLAYEWIGYLMLRCIGRIKNRKVSVNMFFDENEEEEETGEKVNECEKQLIERLQRIAAKSFVNKPTGSSNKPEVKQNSEQIMTAVVSRMVKDLSSRFDDQMVKLNKRLGEIEKQQQRFTAKMSSTSELLINSKLDSAAFDGGYYPQSQNYA